MATFFSATSFRAACRAQGLELHPEVFGSKPNYDDTRQLGDSTGLTDLARDAARQVRKNPGEPLAARRLLSLGSLIGKGMLNLEPFAHDAMATIVAKLVNDSRSPRETSAPSHNFASYGVRGISSCNMVEQHYQTVLDKLRVGWPTTCEIFVDEEGAPILLRKGHPYGISIGLSVSEIAINGMVFDPLWAMRVDAQDDRLISDATSSRYKDVERAADQISVRPISDITGIAPARPTGFVLPAGSDEQKFRFPDLNGERFTPEAIQSVAAEAAASYPVVY